MSVRPTLTRSARPASAPRTLGERAMTWYLQSLKAHDTHRGAITRGRVHALCGIQFEAITVAFGAEALPGQPPDPEQICPECLRKVSAR